MTYEELVEALRLCGKDLMHGERCKDSCPYGDIALCIPKLKLDAAAAIEELQSILTEADKKQAYQHDYICELVAEKEELQAETERLKAQLPKRGEWVVFNKQMLINLENAREQYKELGYPHRTELGLQCSNCRKVTYVDSGIKYEFCPHCGAKMEVQE